MSVILFSVISILESTSFKVSTFTLPTLLKALLRPLLILLSKSTLLFSKVITSLSIFSFKTSKELSILFLLSFKSFSKESLVSLNILEY